MFRHPASKAAAGILSFPRILFPRLPAPCPRNVRLHCGKSQDSGPRWTEGALRGAWLSVPDGSDTCLLYLQSQVLPTTVSPEVMTHRPAGTRGGQHRKLYPALLVCLPGACQPGYHKGGGGVGRMGGEGKKKTKNLQQANNLGRAVDRPLDCCEMTQ